MSESAEQTLIVPCPQCGIRFRVAPELLTVADGQVRCGACFTVFDGNAVSEIAPPTPPAPPAPVSRPPGEAFNEPPGGQPSPPNVMRELRPETPPGPAAAPEAPPTVPFREAPMSSDTFAPRIQEQPDAPWVADVAAPDPAPLEPQPPPARVGARMSIGRGDRRRSKTGREKRTSAPRLLAVALAVALLPLNILALGFERWALAPALRPVYAAGCGLIGCQVPAPQDLEALALTLKSVVRADAGAAIVVTAELRNHAAYPQSLPAVAARFTDASNQLVSEERLTPRDYLPERPTRRLAPGKAATVEFRFPAPGDSATRYALVLQ